MNQKVVPFSTDWGQNMVRTEAWTENDSVIIESTQDIEPIIKQNRIERNAWDIKYDGKFGRADRYHKVACIPNIIVDDLMRKKLWWDKKYMKRWLNDPNNSGYRTGGGYI
jgi:hypothetical protein